MKKWSSYILILLVGLVLGIAGCQLFKSEKESDIQVSTNPKELKDHLRYLESTLDTMHDVKSNPIPGEWLFHNRELQQYPHQFLAAHPNILDEKRNKIYIQPIGSFSPKQEEIVDETAEYISVFYNVEVEVMDSISADEIPMDNRRMNSQGKIQLQTTYIMNKILTPNLPDDARGYMGFTAYDLYPDDNYNFVFGQGKLGGNVGIYSLSRFGYPDWDSTEYSMCLKRTLKVASHELGHIFGFRHCVNYECVMNGSNSMDETDRKPVYLCPLDLLKVTQGLAIDEIYRFRKLEIYWRNRGYEKEASFYKDCAHLLETNTNRREGGIHNN
ncbi:MAG: archaemetzincin, partial [Arenicella sp.]